MQSVPVTVAAGLGTAGHRVDRQVHTMIEYIDLARTTVDSTTEVH